MAIGPASAGGATTQPTFQPVSEKILPAEPDLHRPLRHAGKRRERQMLAAVEHDMLPHLVGEGDRVVADAGLGEQPQLVLAEHPRRRIVRIVEDDQPGPVGERLGQRLAR